MTIVPFLLIDGAFAYAFLSRMDANSGTALLAAASIAAFAINGHAALGAFLALALPATLYIAYKGRKMRSEAVVQREREWREHREFVAEGNDDWHFRSEQDDIWVGDLCLVALVGVGVAVFALMFLPWAGL